MAHAQRTEHARVQTELRLAAGIHAALVPPIQCKAPGLEVLGQSNASAEMGGDLIDLVEHDGVLDVFVADVSGHGVRAGMVMAMVKSALRARLLDAAPLGTVLNELNAVLSDLLEPGMFVTIAAVRFGGGGAITYVLAGHPPVLIVDRSGGVPRRLCNEHLPLGVDRAEVYRESRGEVRAGDLLVLYTDGLTEVRGAQGRQLGVDGLAACAARHAQVPLAVALAAILDEVAAHGRGLDDQTLLLARVVE